MTWLLPWSWAESPEAWLCSCSPSFTIEDVNSSSWPSKSGTFFSAIDGLMGLFGKVCLLTEISQMVQSSLPQKEVFTNWTASSEFGTYRLCEQRRFRRVCASMQSHQNLRCSLIQAVSQEEPSDRKPDPWPLWMAGHAQLKFVMTECSKTQIRLTGLNCQC